MADKPWLLSVPIKDVGARMGIVPAAWEGHCYEISSFLVQLGLAPEGSQAVYGHWLGDVKPGTLFADRAVIQHGWILCADGSIIDPTRWVFEGVEPYIWSGPVGPEYDRGGNMLRMATEGPAPEFDEDAELVDIGFPIECAEFVFGELLRQREWEMTDEQMRWLAHRSPESLGEYARPIFEAIVAADGAAYIPLDNKREVLG